jgi:hypothetical protein
MHMKQTLTLDIPRPLTQLCTLWDTTPQQLIQSFIYDTSQSGRANGNDECWMSIGYLLRCGYYISSFQGNQAFEMLTELADIHLEYYTSTGNQEKPPNPEQKQKQLRAWYKKWEALRIQGQNPETPHNP